MPLVGRPDFLYVADAKLANRAAMDHIAQRGGRFVTVLPRNRREDRAFRDWIFDHEPDWTQAHHEAGGRRDEPDQTWETTPAPSPSAEVYQVIWVRSSTKIDRDAEARRARIAKGIAVLDDLNQRLASPRTRIKAPVAVAPPSPTTHRSAPVVPVPRPAHRRAHRTRDPQRHGHSRTRRHRPLPRTAVLSRPQRHPGLNPRDLHRHHLTDTTGHVVQTFQPTLTPLQHQVLDLLGIPTNTYTSSA